MAQAHPEAPEIVLAQGVGQYRDPSPPPLPRASRPEIHDDQVAPDPCPLQHRHSLPGPDLHPPSLFLLGHSDALAGTLMPPGQQQEEKQQREQHNLERQRQRGQQQRQDSR